MSFAPAAPVRTPRDAAPTASTRRRRVSIAAGPLVGPVLRRVVGMLAARADLPLDRLDDAVLVADLIAARAPAHVAARPSTSAFEPGARTLSLRVGPLRPGGGEAPDRRRRGAGRRQRDRAARRRARRPPGGRAEYLHVRLAYAGLDWTSLHSTGKPQR